MSDDKARKQAFLLLDEILTQQKFANLSLKSGLNGFDERDKAFISALVYGTLDKLITLDHVLSCFAKGKIQPKIKNLLRMGAYQILFMDKVPDSAAVNATVELAQQIGKGMLKGYINGVLRTVAREKANIPYPQALPERLSVQYSYPLFLVNEMIARLGEGEAERFLQYEPDHDTCLRIDPHKADPATVRQQLNARPGMYFDDCCYISGAVPEITDGICSVQGEASVAVVRALDPQRGEKILDACAAPGGKTVYMASRMQDGYILALDKYEHRVELIRQNALRCGYQAVIEARCADMTRRELDMAFDRVLVDAPCSGLGVAGQKPEIKNKLKPEELEQIEEVQAAILEQACRYVKPGGILVYSTCTVREKENSDRITAFLQAHPEFALDPFGDRLGKKFPCKRTDAMVQLYPYRDKIDGFFIARLKRI